jgi:hypothetical protein
MTPANHFSGKPATLKTQDLLSLYIDAQAELQNCAETRPAANSNGDSTEEKEAALSDLESSLLNAAAEISLEAREDYRNLIQFWERVALTQEPTESRPADLIAMNIFRHLMQSRSPAGEINRG